MKVALFNSICAGILGLSVACYIYLLWKISLRFDRVILLEPYANLVIVAFGILLWTVWFGIGQILITAYGEVNGQVTGMNSDGHTYQWK